MSKELINAAFAGNLNEVTRLLALPDIDINYLAIHPSVGYGKYPTTPLVAALSKGKWAVAQLLIMRGARVDTIDNGVYKFEQWFNNAFIYVIAKFGDDVVKVDIDILKLILAKVQIINPSFEGHGHAQSILNYISKHPDKNLSLVPYLFYEALLRNDGRTIGSIFEYKFNPEVTLEAMTRYIGDRTITAKEAFAVNQAMDFLVQKKYLLRSTADEIKQFINKSVKFVLELDAFPAELRTYLQHLTKSSLSELLAELFYLLYPEEGLIPYSLDSKLMAKIDLSASCKTKEELRDWQDPSRVKWLVEMDQTRLLMRFHACAENTRENRNRCSEILAEIVLHHSADIININNHEAPLLSESQQQIFMSLINKLYSLTEMEKVLLNLTHGLDVELVTVKAVCHNLEVDNQALLERTRKIEGRLDQLTSLLVGKGVSALSKKDDDDEDLPKKHKAGLF